MRPRVVNMRHKPWRDDPTSYTYIGRAGKGVEGPFGNPYTAEKYGAKCLVMFRTHFKKRLEADYAFYRLFADAAQSGKPFGCFCVCKDDCKCHRCHGQIMADVWEEIVAEARAEEALERAAIQGEGS